MNKLCRLETHYCQSTVASFSPSFYLFLLDQFIWFVCFIHFVRFDQIWSVNPKIMIRTEDSARSSFFYLYPCFFLIIIVVKSCRLGDTLKCGWVLIGQLSHYVCVPRSMWRTWIQVKNDDLSKSTVLNTLSLNCELVYRFL